MRPWNSKPCPTLHVPSFYHSTDHICVIFSTVQTATRPVMLLHLSNQKLPRVVGPLPWLEALALSQMCTRRRKRQQRRRPIRSTCTSSYAKIAPLFMLVYGCSKELFVLCAESANDISDGLLPSTLRMLLLLLLLCVDSPAFCTKVLSYFLVFILSSNRARAHIKIVKRVQDSTASLYRAAMMRNQTGLELAVVVCEM